MIKDYIKFAFRNFRSRKIRTFLTMIGIFIGIATVVSLISLGQGLKDAVEIQFSSLGSDKIIVHATSPIFGPPGSFATAIITDRDLKEVERTSGIKIATGRVIAQQTIGEFQGDREPLSISGINIKSFLNLSWGTI